MRPHAERLLAVVAGLGLDAVDLAARRERACRQRRAGQQAAAAHADEQRVERADFVEQLLRRGALPRDDVGMVVGRDQGHAALFGQTLADRLAVFAVAVVDDDGRAIAAGRRDLGSRRVVRHDDHRRHAEQRGRKRDRLGVIARGEGDDAGAPLALVEAGQRVEGAAELEGAHALEVFALEEELRAELGVGGARGQHRRAMSVAGDARGRRGDVVVGRQGERHAPAPAARRVMASSRPWPEHRARRASAARSPAVRA